MKSKLLYMVGLTLVVLAGGCGSAATLSKDDISKLNMTDYFPSTDSFQRIYNTYANGNIYGVDTETIHVIPSDNGPKYTIFRITTGNIAQGQKINGIVTNQIQSLINYVVDKDHIEITGMKNSIIGSNQNQTTILSNNSEWKADELTTDQITGVNQQITVKAGTFSNCIEVSEQTKSDGTTVFKKSYYAPKVGLVLSKIKGKDSSDYITLEELVGFSKRSANISSDQTPVQNSTSEVKNSDSQINNGNKTFTEIGAYFGFADHTRLNSYTTQMPAGSPTRSYRAYIVAGEFLYRRDDPGVTTINIFTYEPWKDGYYFGSSNLGNGIKKYPYPPESRYLYIPNHLSVGQSWDMFSPSAIPNSSDGKSTWTVIGTRSINTPAGSFSDCIVIQETIKSAHGATVNVTQYYSKGIGMVEEQREIPGDRTPITTLLSSTDENPTEDKLTTLFGNYHQ